MDENKQAILLLAAQFSAPTSGAPTPLTALEYGRFAAWMRQAQFQPKDLFHQMPDILAQWQDPKKKVTADRLAYLLGRGMAMGLALEKWQNAGIWILTRADKEYPKRLKKHLAESAPAVLFGVGDKNLLNSGGLAVVGSRNIGDQETVFTKTVAKQAALEGLNVVSGGARGVDETAMLAALEIEGSAVGVLANDLFKSALSGKWRKYLKLDQLALVTPFYPEGRFQVGNAMARNKYIYCLSDHALVVRSEKDSGGTWAGATENLKNKNQSVPLFVASPSEAEGNVALLDMGARPVSTQDSASALNEDWLIRQLTDAPDLAPQLSKPPALTSPPKLPAPPVPISEASVQPAYGEDNVVSAVPTSERSIVRETPEIFAKNQSEQSKEEAQPAELSANVEPEAGATYDDFLVYVKAQITDQGEAKFAELKELRPDLKQKQMRQWLDQAVTAGELQRKGRLLSYTLNVTTIDQQGFNF